VGPVSGVGSTVPVTEGSAVATAAWDEPAGATPRGTLVLVPGRGESPAAYQRFGRRLSADAYRVRLVGVDPYDPDDVARARTDVEKLLADEALPGPKVLVGSDTGATLAALWLPEVAADAAVLAGLALPGADGVPGSGVSGVSGVSGASWDDELDGRSACPVHRAVLESDPGFRRGALHRPLPWRSVPLGAPGRPVLLLHGTADRVTPAADALAAYPSSPTTRLRLVDGGRHDVLNDVAHRSVAATVVLFLESLRLGADLPDVVVEGRLG
jgi:alpha-beta hydrolase superfamily lysophospholipase